jgi:hypothetical protein
MEGQGEEERKKLYRDLLNDKSLGYADKIKKYSFQSFQDKLLNDDQAQARLTSDLIEKGRVKSGTDFYEKYILDTPKQAPTPAPKAAPVAPFQQPVEPMAMEGIPVGIAAPKPTKAPAPSVTDYAREMAFEPQIEAPVKPIGVMAPQPIQEPIPSVTKTAREMAFKPPVEPKKPKEKERGFMEWTGDVLGTISAGGERIAKNILSGIGHYAQAQAATDPMASLPYEKRQQMLQEAGQTMYDIADAAQRDFQNEVAKRNIETSVLQAIDKKQYKNIPEAVLYTVGDAAMQIIPSVLTMGGSTYLQTLPAAYKDGVEAIAKEKGISPEQVIASGDDAIVVAGISTGFQSALENIGAGQVSKAIASKGAYKAIRDWLLKQNVNKNLARGAALLGVGVGEGTTEYLQEGTGQTGVIAAKSPTAKAFFERLPNELFTEEAEKQRRESFVGGLIGGGGLAGVGQAITKAFEKPSVAPESDVVPAEEVQGTGRRVIVDSLEEVPQEYRDKVIEYTTGPLSLLGRGKKKYSYILPTETIDITPEAPIAEEVLFEIVPTEEVPPVAPIEEAPIEEAPVEEVTPETGMFAGIEGPTEEAPATSGMFEGIAGPPQEAPVAPAVQFETPTLALPKQEGFAPALRKLGYTDEEISGMTLEQQQDIAINKTEPARAESSSKVDVAKENQRVERIAEAQRKLDEEIAAEEVPAPVTPPAPKVEPVAEKKPSNIEELSEQDLFDIGFTRKESKAIAQKEAKIKTDRATLSKIRLSKLAEKLGKTKEQLIKSLASKSYDEVDLYEQWERQNSKEEPKFFVRVNGEFSNKDPQELGSFHTEAAAKRGFEIADERQDGSEDQENNIELIKETEDGFDVISQKSIPAINDATREILAEVQSEFGGKYTNVDLPNGKILNIRIADHSGNKRNNSGDRNLSVVISNLNPTERFRGEIDKAIPNEIVVNSELTADQIVAQINKAIDKIKAQEGGKQETTQEAPPTPQEGTTVEIAPQREGGSPRKMVFKDGEWKQNVGGDIVKVGPFVQGQAQEMFAGKTETKAEPAKTNEEQIAILRAEEQAELDSRIKNANKYRGEDGKVDRTKLTKKADIKAFDEVYEKYNERISPLMEKKPAETTAQAEFTSKQESSASQEFDGMKKPSKIKTKSFDGKHGKGAFERMKNITDNFEDIMDGMSGKIKQDCL